MQANVRVNINPRLIAQRVPRANYILATQVQRDTEPFVPKITGTLRNTAQIESDDKSAKIIYKGPAAKYLYYGKLMVDPVTGSAWASRGATKTLKDKNLVLAHRGADPDAQDHWFEAAKALDLDKWLKVYGRALDYETEQD